MCMCFQFGKILSVGEDLSLVFTCLQHKSVENTAGKGEMACNNVSTHLENMLFSSNSKLLSAKSFSSEESTICDLGKG